MDKSLRKLSRVELLELMVSMSEDYEDLLAENEHLRQLLSQQRLSKNAKVGSIAEAALQANGYFESAQRSADEYLREIKRLRDDMVARQHAGAAQQQADALAQASAQMQAKARAQAQAQGQAIVNEARDRANQIVAQAQAQAQAILDEAHQRTYGIAAQAPAQDAGRHRASAEQGHRGGRQQSCHAQVARQIPSIDPRQEAGGRHLSHGWGV